ncbi:hypothetical protein SNK04_013842, partial [Fusarium graminearum]
MNVDADTPATEPDTTPTDLTTDALSALDAGIAAADAEEAPAAEPTPADTTPQADAGTPPADDPNAAPPADGQPRPSRRKPQPDAETEAEIASLGLKDKTAERFRTLASEVKELAPIRDALKAAGIEDVAKLPDVVRRAEAGDFLFDEISKTGTSPEQYGMALDYLGLVAKAGQGDLAAAEKAYEVMGKEYAALAKMLGKEAPGIHDPLAAHADLRAEVEAGDLPRARAIEIAGQRDRAEYTGTVQRHQQETQQAAQKAEERGIQWLQQFDADMRQEDPAYEAKRPALNEAVRQIRETYHPSEWAQRTALAYARIQAPVAVAAPPAPAQPATAPRPDAPERPAPGDGSDHLTAAPTRSPTTSVTRFAKFQYYSNHEGFWFDEDRLIANGINIADDGSSWTALKNGIQEGLALETLQNGSQSAKAVPGLDHIVSTTPGTGDVVGGINASTSTYWRNNASMAIASGGVVAALDAMWDACIRYGGAMPTDIRCGQAFLNAYKAEAGTTVNRQIIVNEQGGTGLDASITRVFYKGIELIWDPTFEVLDAKLGAITYPWTK